MIEERFPFTNTNCPTFSSVAGGMCRCKRQEVENASTNIFTWCTEQDGMALIVETFFFFSWHARLRLLTAKRVCIRGHESFSCIIYYFQQRHSSGLKNNIPDEKEISFFFSSFSSLSS